MKRALGLLIAGACWGQVPAPSTTCHLVIGTSDHYLCDPVAPAAIPIVPKSELKPTAPSQPAPLVIPANPPSVSTSRPAPYVPIPLMVSPASQPSFLNSPLFWMLWSERANRSAAVPIHPAPAIQDTSEEAARRLAMQFPASHFASAEDLMDLHLYAAAIIEFTRSLQVNPSYAPLIQARIRDAVQHLVTSSPPSSSQSK